MNAVVEIKNTDIWEKIHAENAWESESDFPSANAQAFARHHLKGRMKVLDLGCGHGAAARLFASKGHDVAGIDASATAIQRAREKTKVSLNIDFTIGNFNELPCGADFYDAVFSDGALYYNSEKYFMLAVDEIYRVLKKGGVARVYTKSNRDKWADTGRPLGRNTYIVEADHYENGLMVYCPPLHRVREIFGKFADAKIGVEEFNYVGIMNVNSFWVITARK